MKKLITIFVLSILLIILPGTGCKRSGKPSESHDSIKLSIKADTAGTSLPVDAGKYGLLADTITYDVIIRNPVTGDIYTEKFLKYLKRDQWVNEIFDAVYSGKLKAFSILENRPLGNDEIKNIEKEKGFSRSMIGKAQFTEIWYFDENTLVMKKKVIAIALGYEHYDKDGTLIGYKPIFRVYFK